MIILILSDRANDRIRDFRAVAPFGHGAPYKKKVSAENHWCHHVLR